MAESSANIYFDAALKARIKELADRERRSLSQMTCLLAEEALNARGLPDPLGEALNSGDGTYKP